MPGNDFTIKTDGDRLKQILSHLLGNACKFTTKGEILFGYARTNRGARFFVTDTGKGIPHEFLPDIFSQFSKYDTFEQGIGLGLSLCKSIVEYLGGEIGAESIIGKGSEFWFFIPYEPSSPHPLQLLNVKKIHQTV